MQEITHTFNWASFKCSDERTASFICPTLLSTARSVTHSLHDIHTFLFSEENATVATHLRSLRSFIFKHFKLHHIQLWNKSLKVKTETQRAVKIEMMHRLVSSGHVDVNRADRRIAKFQLVSTWIFGLNGTLHQCPVFLCPGCLTFESLRWKESASVFPVQRHFTSMCKDRSPVHSNRLQLSTRIPLWEDLLFH